MLFRPLLGLLVSAVAVLQAPPPCPAPSPPDEGWREALFVGVDLKLKLPAGLRPVPHANLFRAARRNHELGIPRSTGDSALLVAAWEGPERGSGEIRRVYFYQLDSSSTQRGRGCALPIAGRSGVVSRHVISGVDRAVDQHWTEVFWPGFVLAAQGVSPSSFESALRIFGTVSSIR